MNIRQTVTRLGLVAALQFGLGCSTVAREAPSSFRDCAACPEMVAVPMGSFAMGASPQALEAARVPEPFASYQMPQHTVTIARPFAIARYPVTRAEYERFVVATNHPSTANCWSWNQAADRYEHQPLLTWRNPGFAQTPRDPVVCVSWHDAKAYVAWLSRVAKESYRLPSESEREYATRAGANTAWPWGDATNAICDYANVSDLSRLAVHTHTQRSWQTLFDCEDGFVYTAPVGSFEPNALGLYDTLGNVWEWVEDCFRDSYAGAPGDGAAATVGDCDQRTLRGGSWFTLTFLNRPAARYGAAPTDRSGHIGFRVARTLD